MADVLNSNASKLEPFILMSKSAKGAAAAKLIQDATSAPGVFVFAELLDVPGIQELANGEHAPYYALLQLFAYKTFADYISQTQLFPSLNAPQLVKLKHLTLVSLSMQSRILPYSRLLEALQISTIRELEDLIIDAIYLDVIRGKLDQKEQQFEVEYTMGRDLEPGDVEKLLATLRGWAENTTHVLASLDNQLSQLASKRETAKSLQDKNEVAYKQAYRDAVEQNKTTKKSSGSGFDDQMDVDEVPEGGPISKGKGLPGGSRLRPPADRDSPKTRKRPGRY